MAPLASVAPSAITHAEGVVALCSAAIDAGYRLMVEPTAKAFDLRVGAANTESWPLHGGSSTDRHVPNDQRFETLGSGSVRYIISDEPARMFVDDALAGDEIHHLVVGQGSRELVPQPVGETEIVWLHHVPDLDASLIPATGNGRPVTSLVREAAVLQELLLAGAEGEVTDLRSVDGWPFSDLLSARAAGREQAVARLVQYELGCDDDVAAKVAAAVLDTDSYPRAVLPRIRSVFAFTHEGFVDGVFQEFVGRGASPSERALFQPELDVGGGRQRVIRNVISSSSARRRGSSPPKWLAELDDEEVRARPERLRRSFALPPAEFMEEVYRVVLQRPADKEGKAHHLASLDRDNDRPSIVVALASSPEAVALGVDPEAVALGVDPEAVARAVGGRLSRRSLTKQQVKRALWRTRRALKSG